MVTRQSSELGWEVPMELLADSCPLEGGGGGGGGGLSLGVLDL